MTDSEAHKIESAVDSALRSAGYNVSAWVLKNGKLTGAVANRKVDQDDVNRIVERALDARAFYGYSVESHFGFLSGALFVEISG